MLRPRQPVNLASVYDMALFGAEWRGAMTKLIARLLGGSTILLAVLLTGCEAVQSSDVQTPAADVPAPARVLPTPTSLAAPAVTPASTPSPAPTATPTAVPTSTPTPSPTPTAAYAPTPSPTSSPTPTPPAPSHTTQGGLDLNPDSAWQEVFDALGTSEQSCIRNALGDDLESILNNPVLSEGEEDRTGRLVSCLDPENAKAVFLFALTWGIGEELDRELSDREAACMRELVTAIDVAVLFGPQDSAEYADFLVRMADTCFAELFGSTTTEPVTTEPASNAPLPAAEVYARVAPSIVFIETPAGTGSGILIDEGYIVTNRHVVWPYESVWVTLPDGTWNEDVPVIGWDALSDLAVLGPVETSIAPVQLADGEDLAPGSELYLVGYPAETEVDPEPTISRGILSRFREWEWFGMTYLQTDASVAGGQSGGALVNDRGHVVGISTFRFGEAGFALATSIADDIAIVDELVTWGWDSADPARRRIPTDEGYPDHIIKLPGPWIAFTFVVDGEAGEVLQLELDGPGDGRLALAVAGPNGLIAQVDEDTAGSEVVNLELEDDGPHFVTVGMTSEDPQVIELHSNLLLTYFPDPDDGETIQIWETLTGNVDHPIDLDAFWLRLKEGESVAVYAESVSINTLVVVGLLGVEETYAFDDNGAGGIFGTDSVLYYRALQAGDYLVVVGDSTNSSVGGYLLGVAAIDALEIWDGNGDGEITCDEAKADDIAPVSSTHPAYEYMDDGDGDGVVCE